MLRLTRFEETRLLSARALQLALGAPVSVKPDKKASVLDLARKELEKDASPLQVASK